MSSNVALDEVGPKFGEMINIDSEKALPALPPRTSYDTNGGRPSYHLTATAIRRQHDLHARYQDEMFEEFDEHPKLNKRVICILLFGVILPVVVALWCVFQLGRLTEIAKQAHR